MNTIHKFVILFSVIIPLFLFSCTSQQEATVPATPVENEDQSDNSTAVDAEFTLKTIADNGKLLYVGVGGDIDGVVNPDLVVQPGSVVSIILIGGDAMVHDLFLPDLDVKTGYVRKIGDQTEIVFEVGDMQPGTYVYYCTLPGHRKAGQEGNLIVEEELK